MSVHWLTWSQWHLKRYSLGITLTLIIAKIAPPVTIRAVSVHSEGTVNLGATFGGAGDIIWANFILRLLTVPGKGGQKQG